LDPLQLDRSFAGRLFDQALLNDLPASVDPCGERGEFHTFVSAGPMFAQGGCSSSIEVRPGEVIERAAGFGQSFIYADLLPALAAT
jgi:diphthamide synthase (EF-2-diphthine--ammonia ligase)